MSGQPIPEKTPYEVWLRRTYDGYETHAREGAPHFSIRELTELKRDCAKKIDEGEMLQKHQMTLWNIYNKELKKAQAAGTDRTEDLLKHQGHVESRKRYGSH